MTNIHWEDQPTSSSSASNIWFGISMLLVGVIVGFALTVVYLF